MTTKSLNTYLLSVKKARGRRRRRSTRIAPSLLRPRTSFKHAVRKSKLSGKLNALKKLIPSPNGEIVKADQLFQETANYIVLLRTRALILQKLIHFYHGTSSSDNQTNIALL